MNQGTRTIDDPTPRTPLVTLHLWGVPRRAVPAAIARMALDGRAVRAAGSRFTKSLGTGDGRTFTPRDADPLHWGLLSTWDDAGAAAAFETTAVPRAWDRLAHERLKVVLRPIASRGRWSGREPFGAPTPRRADASGPVASITRARIKTLKNPRFWRSVPPVSTDLRTVPGLRLAVGIGEAPLGLQGTFSLWSGAEALRDFAYGRAAHTEVVARTPVEGWYAEELFARFAVEELDGTYRGEAP